MLPSQRISSDSTGGFGALGGSETQYFRRKKKNSRRGFCLVIFLGGCFFLIQNPFYLVKWWFNTRFEWTFSGSFILFIFNKSKWHDLNMIQTQTFHDLNIIQFSWKSTYNAQTHFCDIGSLEVESVTVSYISSEGTLARVFFVVEVSDLPKRQFLGTWLLPPPKFDSSLLKSYLPNRNGSSSKQPFSGRAVKLRGCPLVHLLPEKISVSALKK